MDNSTVKILIGVPTADYIEPECLKSIFNLVRPKDVSLEFQFVLGDFIDESRNILADKAIRGGYDYIFYVDSDIILPNIALLYLYSHKVPIVSGLYRAKKEPQKIQVADNNINTLSDDILRQARMVEIGGGGFGCMLVRVDVLKRIGYPQFVYRQAIIFEEGFSEDNYFCCKARVLGYRIWADTQVQCVHIGHPLFKLAEN